MKISGVPLVAIAEAWLTVDPQNWSPCYAAARRRRTWCSGWRTPPRLRFWKRPGAATAPRTLIDALLGRVVDVLDQSSYTAAMGQRLYFLAAELGRMAGWASFDAGLHAEAQRYWLAALHAAHAAGDRLLGSNILKSMSLQCYDFDQPHEALALASSAYQGREGGQPTRHRDAGPGRGQSSGGDGRRSRV